MSFTLEVQPYPQMNSTFIQIQIDLIITLQYLRFLMIAGQIRLGSYFCVLNTKVLTKKFLSMGIIHI